MSKKKNEWKNREGVVYSTQSDFGYREPGETEPETLAPHRQTLTIRLDKNSRAGKQVTLVSGFVGSSNDLEKLSSVLKSGCGVGGAVKDNTILIQGDLGEKVMKLLQLAGYRPKRSG